VECVVECRGVRASVRSNVGRRATAEAECGGPSAEVEAAKTRGSCPASCCFPRTTAPRLPLPFEEETEGSPRRPEGREALRTVLLMLTILRLLVVFFRSHLTRLSRSSAFWPRSRGSTDLCLSGSVCELITRSDTTASAGTGEGLSSDCKFFLAGLTVSVTFELGDGFYISKFMNIASVIKAGF